MGPMTSCAGEAGVVCDDTYNPANLPNPELLCSPRLGYLDHGPMGKKLTDIFFFERQHGTV